LMTSGFSSDSSLQVIALRWKRAHGSRDGPFTGGRGWPFDRACRMEPGERGRHASGHLCTALVWSWADRALEPWSRGLIGFVTRIASPPMITFPACRVLRLECCAIFKET
jgi:hypothetical protein